MSDRETVYSEPIEKAENLIEQGNNLQLMLENFAKDKTRAQELLDRAKLSDVERNRLDKLVAQCDKSITDIQSQQMRLSKDIQKLLAEHIRLQQILDNFEPDIYH